MGEFVETISNKGEIQTFLRKHPSAWKFATKASHDYLLARWGIQNALWSGFEMATQATEKLLKSYLLFADPSFSGKVEEVRKAVSKESRNLGRTQELGHDVEACLQLAANAGFLASEDLGMRIKRINSYYSLRYPDNDESPKSLGTDEINDIDEAIFEIWDVFKAFNEDYFYTCGIMMPIYSKMLNNLSDSTNPMMNHSFSIMTQDNNSYSSRKDILEKGIQNRLQSWYPK
jgi:hypothetical protein